MIRFIVRRLLWAIPTLFIITFLVFLAIRIGTDPVQSYLRVNPRASRRRSSSTRRPTASPAASPEQYFQLAAATSSRATGATPSRATGRCGRS